MAGFANFKPPEAQVIRNGKQQKLPERELIPGTSQLQSLEKKSLLKSYRRVSGFNKNNRMHQFRKPIRNKKFSIFWKIMQRSIFRIYLKEMVKELLLQQETGNDFSKLSRQTNNRRCFRNSPNKIFQPIFAIVETQARFQIAQDKQKQQARKPFNSMNKYAFIIVEQQKEDSYYCLQTKGAPEKIWNLCNKVYFIEEKQSIDKKWNKECEYVNARFGRLGERMLGFFRYDLPIRQFPKGFNFDLDHYNFPFNQQVFVSIISLIDPPGIQVIMVTGDQPKRLQMKLWKKKEFPLKKRFINLIFTRFHKQYQYLAYFVELLVTFNLSNVEVFNTGFGTRDLLFIHYGIC